MNILEEKYNRYYYQYNYITLPEYTLSKELIKIFHNNTQKLKIYNEIIYPSIRSPYMFSDHRNKAFHMQYLYLRKNFPELWKINDSADTFLKGTSNDYSLPIELMNKIYHYAKSDWIIEMMAIASHVAFHMYSD